MAHLADAEAGLEGEEVMRLLAALAWAGGAVALFLVVSALLVLMSGGAHP